MEKKLILMIILFIGVSSINIFAQEIEYTYDAAGNRVKKEFIISGSSNSPHNREKESFTDEIDSTSVKIYPNPTQGIVNLHFDNKNTQNQSPSTIRVIDLNGSILFEEGQVKQNIKIDFANFSNGIYILQIQNNETISNWRIIKQ